MASAAQRIAFSGGGDEVKQSPIKRGGKESGQKGPFSFAEIARPHRGAYDDERTRRVYARALSLFLRAYACSLPLVHYEPGDRVSLAAGTFSRFFSAARWSLTPGPCPPGPTRPRAWSCSRILRTARRIPPTLRSVMLVTLRCVSLLLFGHYLKRRTENAGIGAMIARCGHGTIVSRRRSRHIHRTCRDFIRNY